MAETVELHPAHMWDCPDCGRENFCRSVTVEFSDEDRRAMAGEYGTDEDEWVTGNWMTSPDEVTCAHCGKSYETKDSRADDE